MPNELKEYGLYKNRSKSGNNISGANIKRLRKSLPEKTSQRLLAYKVQLLGLDLYKNAIQRIESGDRFLTDIELKSLLSFSMSALTNCLILKTIKKNMKIILLNYNYAGSFILVDITKTAMSPG